MPLDPQARSVIDRRAASVDPGPGPDATLDEKRAAFEATWREAGPELSRVEDHDIEEAGERLRVRVYWHEDSVSGAPCLIVYHGGGFVFGSVESYDAYARRMCRDLPAVVVNVGYRRAPEHPFPAAHDDAYAAFQWVARHAVELGIDPECIAVGGDSAGANLATGVAMRAIAEVSPVTPVGQVLICPTVQPGYGPTTHDTDETPPSGREWWWGQYLQDERDRSNPYAAPLVAPELSGLPPALVITAEYDDLRDEGEAYATRLADEGVDVTFTRYEGMWHVFHFYPSHIDKAAEAVEQELAFLRQVLGIGR